MDRDAEDIGLCLAVARAALSSGDTRSEHSRDVEAYILESMIGHENAPTSQPAA